MADNYAHLPRWARKALDQYERDITDGWVTFNHGEFADMPSSDPEGWLRQHLADHLPALDVTPHDDVWERPDPYPGLSDGGFHPTRPDGLETYS